MSFRLVPKSVTLNGIMAVTLRYFTEFSKPALQKTICGGIYARVYCILVRVQRRRKESSRSLSHLLMSFLFLHERQLSTELIVFSEPELISSVRLSYVCRLSVTFVRPTLMIEIFCNVSTPFGTLAIC